MNRLSSNQIFGILLVFIGVLFTLDNLFIIELDLSDLIFSLPTILFLVGIGAFKSKERTLKPYLLLGLAALGWILIIMGYSPFHLLLENWPIILILLGLSIIFGHSKRTGNACRNEDFENIETTCENEMDEFVFWRGLKRGFSPGIFNGGNITVFMGGAGINFGECDLNAGKTVLHITVVMGGLELRVPRDWNVIYNGVTLFGGTEDQRLKYPNFNIDINKTLEIKGLVLFGGLEIK